MSDGSSNGYLSRESMRWRGFVEGVGQVSDGVASLFSVYSEYLGVCSKGSNPIPMGFSEFLGMAVIGDGDNGSVSGVTVVDSGVELGLGSGSECGRNGDASVSGGSGVDVSNGLDGGVDALGVDSGCVEPRWRVKKRERELRRKARRVAEKKGSEVVNEVSSAESGIKVVPEWRRKGTCVPRASRVFEVRKERAQLSKFRDCEEGVRKSLVDTQAKRYIAENEAAVVRAKNQVLKMEEDSRRVAARLKTGVTEQNVELQRLNLNAKLAVHAAAFYKEHGVGFAETVASEGLSSVLSVPSSDGGCVSPDSSVSVAMVKKMERIIKDQSVKVAELERKLLKCGIAVELDEVHILTGQPMDALGLPIEEVADENLSLEDYQAVSRSYL